MGERKERRGKYKKRNKEENKEEVMIGSSKGGIKRRKGLMKRIKIRNGRMKFNEKKYLH